MKVSNWNRCDVCGRFIALADKAQMAVEQADALMAELEKPRG